MRSVLPLKSEVIYQAAVPCVCVCVCVCVCWRACRYSILFITLEGRALHAHKIDL